MNLPWLAYQNFHELVCWPPGLTRSQSTKLNRHWDHWSLGVNRVINQPRSLNETSLALQEFLMPGWDLTRNLASVSILLLPMLSKKAIASPSFSDRKIKGQESLCAWSWVEGYELCFPSRTVANIRGGISRNCRETSFTNVLANEKWSTILNRPVYSVRSSPLPGALGLVFVYINSTPFGLRVLRMHKHNFLFTFLHTTQLSMFAPHIL